MQCIEPKNY